MRSAQNWTQGEVVHAHEQVGVARKAERGRESRHAQWRMSASREARAGPMGLRTGSVRKRPSGLLLW